MVTIWKRRLETFFARFSAPRKDADGSEIPWYLDWRRMLRDLAIILAVLLTGFRYLAPIAANKVLYLGLYLHLVFLIPVAAGSAIAAVIYKNADFNRKPGMTALYYFVNLVFVIGFVSFIQFGQNWKICQTYPFAKRPALVAVDKAAIRYTPLHVAYQDMKQTYNESGSKVDEDLVDAVDVDGKFGYSAQVTPHGVINVLIGSNPAVVFYHDGFDFVGETRSVPIRGEWEVGEGLEYFDNVWWQLYESDIWCEYESLYFTRTTAAEREVIGVAPKIVYKFAFPFFVPSWGGVAILHKDGRIENLSPKEALADTRLSGARIYPISLAEKYVGTQIYDVGLWGGVFRRKGKIEVPTLPGDNQMPFYTKAADGGAYFVTATEPDGSGTAIFRMYYVNARSGERTFFEYNVDQGLRGPGAALTCVKSLPAYKWRESVSGGSATGDFDVVEPTYLTKEIAGKTQLFWKASIVPSNYSRVASTAVVNPGTGEVTEFKTREEFAAWLGIKVESTKPVEKASLLEKAEKLATELLKTLGELRAQAKSK